MAKINMINNQSSELTIDPGSSGDSFIQLDINSTSKFIIGVDDDDSDKFKISTGSALGTGDSLVIDSSGRVSKPYQPAFSAYLSSTVDNVTGDLKNYHIIFNQKLFDIGDDYNTTTGYFTAPVTGKYRLMATCWLKQDGTTGATQQHMHIQVSSGNLTSAYLPGRGRVANYYGASNSITNYKFTLIDLDVGDTAKVLMYGGGGSRVDDILGGAVYTVFSGYLVC